MTKFSLRSVGTGVAVLMLVGLAACKTGVAPKTSRPASIASTPVVQVAEEEGSQNPDGPAIQAPPAAIVAVESGSADRAFLISSIANSATTIIETVRRVQDWTAQDSIEHQGTAACGYLGMLHQQVLEAAQSVRQLDANLVAPPQGDRSAQYLRIDLDEAARYTQYLFGVCNGNDPHFHWESSLFASLADRGPVSLYFDVDLTHYCGEENLRPCDIERDRQPPVMKRVIAQLSFAFGQLTNAPLTNFLTLSPE